MKFFKNNLIKSNRLYYQDLHPRDRDNLLRRGQAILNPLGPIYNY